MDTPPIGATPAASLALPAIARAADGVARTGRDIAFAPPAAAVDGEAAMDETPDARAEVHDLPDAGLRPSTSGDGIEEGGDLVADASGRMRYSGSDSGGFLGLGEQHVLVPLEEVRVMTDGGDGGPALRGGANSTADASGTRRATGRGP